MIIFFLTKLVSLPPAYLVALAGLAIFVKSVAGLVTHARLSTHQLPSYWSTRNRSVGACSAMSHTWWCATGSAAQRGQVRAGSLSKIVAERAVSFIKIVTVRTVRFTQVFINQTSSAPRCVQAAQRMPDDRFLVPQYEGVGHTLRRPKQSNFKHCAFKAMHDPQPTHY